MIYNTQDKKDRQMKVIVTLSKTFFPQHPRKGEATEFRGKMLSGDKRHTCRQNYAYWKRRIERIQATDGILSVKQWIGRPYHQPGQEPILDVPSDVVGFQRLELRRRGVVTEIYAKGRKGPFENHLAYEWIATVDGRPVPIEALAANDGLTVEDFKAWFAPAFKKAKAEDLEFAIIHFTKFRY